MACSFHILSKVFRTNTDIKVTKIEKLLINFKFIGLFRYVSPLVLVLKQEFLALALLGFPFPLGCNRSFNPVSKGCSRFRNLIPLQLWLIDQKLIRELKGLPFKSTFKKTSNANIMR